MDTPNINYQIIWPCEELKNFVSHFWVSQWNNSEPPPYTYYYTANTHTEVAFAFRPSSNGRSQLVFSSVLGHTKSAGQIPMDGFTELFGVSLFSYAVPSLFNVAHSELADQMLGFDVLLSTHGEEIGQELAECATTAERVNVLTAFFKSQLAKRCYEDETIIAAVKEIKKHSGTTSISQLASQFCLSQKQFERRFKDYSGFNPKLFSRITRFEAALWNRRQYRSLAEVAHAYGYHDQSHFIHDFALFAGHSPTTFFSAAGY